jgi:hypothetical protein
MAKKLIFKNAEAARDAIMDSQKKEIANLYESWADEIGERAKFYSHKSTASAPVSERYYKELQKQIRATSQQVSNEIYGKIKNNIYTIADAVVADNVEWLKSFGFSEKGLNAAFSYVPDNVVRNLATGQIYEGGWNLSSRIWGDNEQTLKDAYQIMAKGVAMNKPIYEITKDLEAYVRPSAKLPWNPVLAMKNTKTGKIEYKRIYKKQVDYNAQRLARTLAQHSYQQSFLATTQNNPFISEYIWISNGSRVCDLCKARDGMHFKKNELPMDHPNGMCIMEPVVAEDMVDQLTNWFNSPDGTYPEIDAFAGNFGYNASKTGTVQDYLNKYGTSTKNPSAWYHSLSPVQKAEAKLLKDASGLSWDEWYEKFVYSGSSDDIAAYKAKITAKKAAKKTVTKTATKAKTETVQVFSEAQEKYLSPGGYTPSKMPDDFDDWYFKTPGHKQIEILESLGIDWSDATDNEIYNALFDFYNNNLTSSNLVTKVVTKADDVVSATVKVSKTVTSEVVDKIDDAFDSIAWMESLRNNELTEMDSWTKDWLKAITKAEKSGVVKYTSNAFYDMNSYLRGLRPNTKYATAINNCQSALSKASLPKETIVCRGSDYNMLNSLGIGKVTKENKGNFIGAIVEDKGFTSTTPSYGDGFYRDIEYVIKVPKGSQAMYVNSISEHDTEKELLINCGSKFIVENVEFDSYGDVNKIFMTLINLQ